MPSILYKTDSGTDKQIIKPKEWTYVRFDKLTKFKVPADGIYTWAVILRVEYTSVGSPISCAGDSFVTQVPTRPIRPGMTIKIPMDLLDSRYTVIGCTILQ